MVPLKKIRERIVMARTFPSFGYISDIPKADEPVGPQVAVCCDVEWFAAVRPKLVEQNLDAVRHHKCVQCEHSSNSMSV